jgi:NADP-dependent 3-hydroxy acid dehydrogenase YdfG
MLQAALSTKPDTRVLMLDNASSEIVSAIGGASGLCRTLRIERPEADVFAVSLDACGDIETTAAGILQTLSLKGEDYTLRPNGIWKDIPGENLTPPSSRAVDYRIPPVWIISGGARGVTADCTIELAKRTGGHFALLGRSAVTAWPEWLEPEQDLKTLRGVLARNIARPGMPAKPVEIDRLARNLLAGAEITNTLKEIEMAGACARYFQVDIGDRTSLQSALSKITNEQGTVTGLVHGAGVLSDGVSESLQLADFHTVFEPKVSGLLNILSCLDMHALRHIGLFSSASAVFGNPGQANYAAANAWLNNVAEKLTSSLPETQVKSFCWGPWQGGMVNEALARMFAERGIGLIARPEGARIFADQLLLSPHDQVRFVIGDEWGHQ